MTTEIVLNGKIVDTINSSSMSLETIGIIASGIDLKSYTLVDQLSVRDTATETIIRTSLYPNKPHIKSKDGVYTLTKENNSLSLKCGLTLRRITSKQPEAQSA